MYTEGGLAEEQTLVNAGRPYNQGRLHHINDGANAGICG